MREPDTDNFKNMPILMKYTHGTIGLPLILSIDKSGYIKWYVDVAFAVHKDTGSHTGGFMTMGTLVYYVTYRKQKLITKISTESELVEADNVPTQVIWTRYFLKEQGYEIHGKFIYQYNQIIIKLEKDGRQSIRKWIRHINIRYYFITNIITNQEASKELFPTLEMIGIISQRHYRDINSVTFVKSLLVSPKMKLLPIMHLE